MRLFILLIFASLLISGCSKDSTTGPPASQSGFTLVKQHPGDSVFSSGGDVTKDVTLGVLDFTNCDSVKIKLKYRGFTGFYVAFNLCQAVPPNQATMSYLQINSASDSNYTPVDTVVATHDITYEYKCQIVAYGPGAWFQFKDLEIYKK